MQSFKTHISGDFHIHFVQQNMQTNKQSPLLERTLLIILPNLGTKTQVRIKHVAQNNTKS